MSDERNKCIQECLQLIKKSQDSEAVERLYELMGRTIKHIGLKYLHDMDEADDFVQDFWADIYSIANGFFFIQNGYAYLCKVAMNRAINRYQQRCRQKAHITFVDYSLYIPCDTKNQMEQIELRLVVEAALMTLSEIERVVIQAVYFEQKTIRQIAAELKLSKSKVDRIKKQAMRKLKKNLE